MRLLPSLPISIHALREEGDTAASSFSMASMYFNPRPPRGGRPASFATGSAINLISIHALREEGDSPVLAIDRSTVKFQSTPSARRAT